MGDCILKDYMALALYSCSLYICRDGNLSHKTVHEFILFTESFVYDYVHWNPSGFDMSLVRSHAHEQP